MTDISVRLRALALLWVAGLTALGSRTAVAQSYTSPASPPLSAAVAVPPPDILPPPYIDQADNVVEFKSRSAIAHFADSWARRDYGAVVIAHFGDSHVQKGYITEAARQVLEEKGGYGGRGMVFPYAIAKTYSQSDFNSSFTGTWRTGNSMQQPPRLPVGVSGFAAQTNDPSVSVTLTFKRPLDPGPKQIRLFYSVSGAHYRLTLTTGGTSKSMEAAAYSGALTSNFDLPQASDTVTLQIEEEQPSAGAGTFTLRGISIENDPPTGVVYHNLGVGGAVFEALLQQAWFEPEIKDIHPDLVILDWGTNDLLFTNAPSPAFEQIVLKTIDRVRRAVPDASILLTSTQDMTFRHRDVTSTEELSRVLRRLAFSSGCLYWDWFRVSGGPGSNAEWKTDTLFSSDGIHLTGLAYRLKGRLLAEALLKTIDYAESHPQVSSYEAPSGH